MSVTETDASVDDGVVCQWTVTAGCQPTSPADRFTRSFVVTSEDWGGGDVAGRRLRIYRQQEAIAYASQLMSDEALAWVWLDYRSHDRSTADGEIVGADG